MSTQEKVLSVSKDENSDAIIPTLETVQDMTYPISRHLYFYTQGEPSESTKAFMEFVLSEEGQEVVQIMDFIPLKQA